MQDIIDEMTTDEAFLSATTPKTLNGLKLEPFTLQRQLIARELNSSPTTSEYYDQVLTVWVCTLNEEQLMNSRIDMSKAAAEAFRWAQEQGCALGKPSPLRPVYDQIMAELNAATLARAKDTPEEPAKNDGKPQA
jgi:hypothetical protein